MTIKCQIISSKEKNVISHRKILTSFIPHNTSQATNDMLRIFRFLSSTPHLKKIRERNEAWKRQFGRASGKEANSLSLQFLNQGWTHCQSFLLKNFWIFEVCKVGEKPNFSLHAKVVAIPNAQKHLNKVVLDFRAADHYSCDAYVFVEDITPYAGIFWMYVMKPTHHWLKLSFIGDHWNIH